MKTQDTKNKFIELRAKGYSYDKIAKQLKVSKQTLINWGNEFKNEIDELTAIELEVLKEKYYLLKQRRIELFGEEILRLKSELSCRDLKKVHTYRLYNLLFKIYSLFDREHKEAVEVDKIQAQTQKCVEELKKMFSAGEEEPIYLVFNNINPPSWTDPAGKNTINLTREDLNELIKWKIKNQK